MKKKFFHISLISLISFIMIILNINTIQPKINVLKDLYKFIQDETDQCQKDLENALDKEIMEKDKKYPWLMDSLGKGINDLGDEIECRNSLIDTVFVIAKLQKEAVYSLFYYNDTTLMRYLEISNFATGMCLIKCCKEIIETEVAIWFDKIINATNNNIEIKGNHSITYEESEDNNKKFKYALFLMFLIYIVIKLSFGLLRLILVPKGYDKYATDYLEKQGKLENIDNEEKMVIQDGSEILKKETNISFKSYFDYSSFLPPKYKIMKFFDLINDINLITTKKNKYYNDNNIETLILMRNLVIYFLVFSGTFTALLSIPSKDVFSKYYFETIWICIFKISINSLTCWIVLEAAYTTFKLLNYIKAQIIENNIRKKNLKTELFKIFGKFMILFIPKIIVFFIIYYSFYYKIEEFQYMIEAKATYNYIAEKIIKVNIKCAGNPFKIFNFNIFSRDYKDYDECYEFTYIYFNILICTIIFMAILYFSFLLRSKLFEIIIILINLILFFCSVLIIKDGKIDKDYEEPKTNEDTLYYKYYHLVGQKYSTKILYSLIGFYHLGYILGFMFFYYDNNKYKYMYINRITTENTNNYNKRKSSKDIMPEDNKIEIAENANDNINYFPLFFLNDFLFWINNIKHVYKHIIIYICMALLLLLSMSFQIYLKVKEPDYIVKLTTLAKLYFFYEKHLFIILFLIITVISLTMTKKGIFKRLINSSFFISTSRIGFSIVCLYYILIYLLLCFILIKAKFHTQTIVLLSIGNFLLIYIYCLLINIIIEIPFTRLSKNLIRKKK